MPSTRKSNISAFDYQSNTVVFRHQGERSGTGPGDDPIRQLQRNCTACHPAVSP
ncbi:MAG: hypothetical protein MZV70_66125 [Desulfobacterales bacterium]|nr:hypothetical protein [Desulfobacterales bacterium]